MKETLLLRSWLHVPNLGAYPRGCETILAASTQNQLRPRSDKQLRGDVPISHLLSSKSGFLKGCDILGLGLARV